MLNNINEYSEDKFKEKFTTSDLYMRLESEYTKLSFRRHYLPELIPRHELVHSTFSVVPFYYIEYLQSHNPTYIYDLGCGFNVFKKYIPNIIGLDPDVRYKDVVDIVDSIDKDYIKYHQNYFESAMSINSLHFRPLSEIRNVVLDFISMLKPQGCGYISLNLQRMIERDNSVYTNYDTFIRSELDNIDAIFEVVDIDLSDIDNYLDGNISLVIQKN